ncbi:MAG: OmpH family outer membrane protein [Armatimonadetes bacterium]|nr:OmpH family outer membrane protein [Armatimonadota bacterium]
MAVRLPVLGLFLTCLLAATSFVVADTQSDTPAAPAQQPAMSGLKIAVVDVKRINDEFVRPQARNEETANWARRQQQYIDELQNRYIYLSEEAFNEIIQILGMSRPLPAEAAKRQRELQDVNDKTEARFLDLQRKVDRTAEEQEEFNRLQAGVDARNKQVEQIVQNLQNQLNQMQMDTIDAAMDRAQTVIVEVATAGGYSLVFAKAAVIHGGDDITDQVLEKLAELPTGSAKVGAPGPPAAAPAPAPAATP